VTGFHQPVMLRETAKYLINRTDGTYLDATCGGGGHLKHIAGLLDREAMLIGIDRDSDAIQAASKNLQGLPQKLKMVNSDFSELDRVLEDTGVTRIDGILFDLGVSSHQIDVPERGFSFMQEGPLDMRMNARQSLTAEKVLNEYSFEQLKRIFHEYGEEKRGGRVARRIIEQREISPVKTTGRLREILASILAGKDLTSSLARLFQAVRIEVNRELDELSAALPRALGVLAEGGRMVVIAYHSLEDRIVKRFFAAEAKGCICPENIPVCVCGRKPTVRLLTRRVVRPSEDETSRNPRSRSARLRAVEKI
jgi:16S rRNA (cytosine1402-N4)-methyltransferase